MNLLFVTSKSRFAAYESAPKSKKIAGLEQSAEQRNLLIARKVPLWMRQLFQTLIVTIYQVESGKWKVESGNENIKIDQAAEALLIQK